jgi:hypothetical protein
MSLIQQVIDVHHACSMVMVAANESLKRVLNPNNENNLPAFLAVRSPAFCFVHLTGHFAFRQVQEQVHLQR